MMPRATYCCFLGLAITVAGGQLSAPPKPSYRPAVFQGLRLGTATRSSLIERLGQPDYSGHPEGAADAQEDGYERPGLFPLPYERVRVISDRKTEGVTDVIVQLKEPVRIDSLRMAFKGQWMVTRWKLEVCPDPESGVLFQSASGPIAYWENRSLGLSYRVGSFEFEYRSGPIGAAKPSGCKPRSANVQPMGTAAPDGAGTSRPVTILPVDPAN